MQSKSVWVIGLISLCVLTNSCTPEGEAITNQDRYKLWYQDQLGAEHIGLDSLRALNGIKWELEHMPATAPLCSKKKEERKISDYYFFENPKSDYVRLDLQAVRDSVISAEELAGIFARTANEGGHPLLNKVPYAVHHSEQFKERYKPHYRVVKKDLLR